MSQTIAIFGATSAIAKGYARLKSNQSNRFILIGRNNQTLEELKIFVQFLMILKILSIKKN